jgi:uncharacterized protein YndB with AHSA1/START domain
MATRQTTRPRGRVTDEAVRNATGRGWEEWLALLDAAGAAGWDHKRIVAHLEEAHPQVASSWWRQSLTVEYEKRRGKRVLGETADAGFQVGVRRTVPLGAKDAWRLVTSRAELWLGDGARLRLEKGARYEAAGGNGLPAVTGEVRVVKPGDRLRMTWQPAGWKAPATLQVTLEGAREGKTGLTVHLERLPDARAREAMRARFGAALERLVAAAPAQRGTKVRPRRAAASEGRGGGGRAADAGAARAKRTEGPPASKKKPSRRAARRPASGA